MKTAAQLDAEFEAMRRARQIWCPYCGKEYVDDEYSHVTYHAEDGPKEAFCGTCERPFLVKERVERTYESFAMEATNV